MKSIVNGLSVDVEEYFQVEAAAERVPPETWGDWPSRVEEATERVLAVFAGQGIGATFFFLGWVAERRPHLVRRVAAAGHEIACHGYAHQHITRTRPEDFRKDVRRAKQTLEDITGLGVAGYRAPTFSIYADTLWALDILIEEGFLYDSSIFPVRHDRYGMPNAPRRPTVLRRPAGSIVELPPLTLRVGGLNLPAAGGGYMRLLPMGVVLWAVRRANREGLPAVIYLHPWELDPAQPRLPLGLLGTWRHRVGLASMEGKLRRLVSEVRFHPLLEIARRTADRGEIRSFP